MIVGILNPVTLAVKTVSMVHDRPILATLHAERLAAEQAAQPKRKRAKKSPKVVS